MRCKRRHRRELKKKKKHKVSVFLVHEDPHPSFYLLSLRPSSILLVHTHDSHFFPLLVNQFGAWVPVPCSNVRYMAEAFLPSWITTNRSSKLACPKATPRGGEMMSSTNEFTSAVKDAPMINPTANPTTFPLSIKSYFFFNQTRC